MRKFISLAVNESLNTLYNFKAGSIDIDIPKNFQGDYSVNVALKYAKNIGKNPKDIATKITQHLKNLHKFKENFSSIEIIGPGFIHFTHSKQVLLKLFQENKKMWGEGDSYKGENILIEFAHPNTHKAFHIGHLRTTCLGESLSRILKSQKANIFRANYQGDIGLHVAKCIWGLIQLNITDTEKKLDFMDILDSLSTRTLFKDIELETPQQKAEYLGKSYAYGSQNYIKNRDSKKEIHIINLKLYEGTHKNLINIYKKSRKWSLEYFDSIYKRLYTRFNRLFFESETWKPGKDLVLKHTGKVFKKSKGAIIFQGEKYGLHSRVFVTSEGNPTYEAKDIALASIQQEAFQFDKNIHVVASEQSAYFKVIFEALEQIHPGMKEKQLHLSYGMVVLSSGKMSSRTGDVITGEWLLDEIKNKVNEILENREMTKEEKEAIAEIVTIGAAKFTMLHTQSKNDIIFDVTKAASFEGDSGPYIQYAIARICSIFRKEDLSIDDILAPSKRKMSSQCYYIKGCQKFNESDWKLLRRIMHFPYQVERCAKELTTHYLTHYLLKLVSEFSKWYNANSVLKAETTELKLCRLEILKLLLATLKNGLDLLGIKTSEKM